MGHRLGIVAALVVLAACSASAETPEVVRIAFVQDLSAPDAEEHAQPAREAAELAVAFGGPMAAAVELVVIDLADGPGVVDEIDSDPSILAAIVGPGADGSVIAEAGLPTVSVSTAGPTPSDGTWRRLVAPMAMVADAIASLASGTTTCVLSEEPAPDALAMLLTERIDGPAATGEPASMAGFAERRGCGAVAWAGSPDPAVKLAGALQGTTSLVGGDRLLDRDYRDDVGPAGEGTIAVCACADITTSLEPPAMGFVQDYQSEFGTAPGAYAVEAWDATTLVLGAVGASTSRSEVAAALSDVSMSMGLAGTYAFDARGERVDAPTRAFELRSGRWVAAGT